MFSQTALGENCNYFKKIVTGSPGVPGNPGNPEGPCEEDNNHHEREDLKLMIWMRLTMRAH